jgi:predicted molibdopterin-dependent oxidoreductase YjgC
MGEKYRYNTAEEVFRELAAAIPAFRGLSYSGIGNKGMQLKEEPSAAGVLRAHGRQQ